MTKFLILFYILLACNQIERKQADEIVNPNYYLIEDNINSLTGFYQMTVIENDSIVIFNNKQQNELFKYNYKTGSLLATYKSDLSLSDTFALSKHQPGKSLDSEWIHLTNKQFEELTGFDVLNKSIITNYLDQVLLNGSTLFVGSLSYCYKHKLNDPKYTGIANTRQLLEFDSHLNLNKVISFESTGNAYPSLILEILPNGQFLNKNMIGYKGFYRSKDSLPAVSLYDTDGSFLKEIAYLPEFFYKKDIGYRLFPDPKYTSFNQKRYIAYGYVEKIFCLDKKDTILLQNLEFSNEDKYDSLDLEIGKGLKDFDYFGFFPNLIKQISLYQNELYVVLTKLTKTGERDYVLQKYNIQNGRFVQEVNLNHLKEYTIYILPDHSKIYFAGLDEESEEYFISFMEL